MAEYRYLAYDLRTNQFRRELPLSNVSYSEQLNSDGEFSASLDLATTTGTGASISRDLVDATIPRRTRLIIERDGQIVWSGIIWTRRRSNGSSGIVDLAGFDLMSYFGRRRLTVTRSYAGVDQLAVARDLITWAESQPGGDILVQTGSETSGVLLTRDPLAYGHEYRNIADLINELAGAETGFDWSISTAWDPTGVPTYRLELHYPRRGRTALAADLVFFKSGNNGGNLIDWELEEDGLDSALTVYGLGAGEGETMIQTVATRTALLDAGYPLTEATISYKAVTDVSALVGLAAAEVAERSEDRRTLSITVDPDDVSVPFGTWVVGDDARIVIDDDLMFPASGDAPGYEATHRIVGQRVAVSDDGGPDDVTLELGVARG